MKDRIAAVVVAAGLFIGLPLAWIAGEQHRENCIREGQVSCSVLPWNNGESKSRWGKGGVNWGG